MSNHDLSAILQSIDALSVDQQQGIFDHLARKLAAEHRNEAEFKRRLLSSGLVTEIRPPVTDFEPYRNRTLATIVGKPVSETVIEERR